MKRFFLRFALSLVAISVLASGAQSGRIYLKSGTIDTALTPQLTALEPEHTPGSGYYLVQLAGPITDQDKEALAKAGAEVVEYVPDNAFIARVEHRRVGRIKKIERVAWVGPYRPDHKGLNLLSDTAGARRFTVALFPGANTEVFLGKAKMLGAKNLACAQGVRGAVCRILADKSQLAELARSGSVAWIEPFVQPVLCNDVATGICGAPDVRQSLGLFGAGQLIGVADAGLDTGDFETMSADFAGRIQKTYALRRLGEWSDLTGHGTHVTGSLLGSGVLSGGNPPAHLYDGSFAGIAPEADLVFQSIGDDGNYVYPPLHLAELFQPVYDDGVRVHSNSWGSAVAGQYTVYSREVDQFVWDHKDFAAVFAVGNESEDLDHNGVADIDALYAPATAKNCISVGATESFRLAGGRQIGYGIAWPASYPAAPIKYDLMSNNAAGMTAFSSRGPTDDGRVKPDICAPGTNIISCRSHVPGASTGWNVYNSDYVYWGGTSMSTPQVAGGAALVREYFEKEKGISPSAALVKATLISGAADISPGQYGTSSYREVFPAPDNSQGWGRLDIRQSLSPDPPIVNEFADEFAPLSTGEVREYQYTVIDTSVPFKATLVWTDYAGAVLAAKELVNDLDLTIISPGGTTYPTGGICDHVNNVEQFEIGSPELGTHRVRVTGYDIPMGPQDYALVVSGGMPATYIGGAVTSVSGAPVQGAMIALVSANGTKRVTTNSSGKYVSHVAPGLYSVQVGKPGWTFAPRAQIVEVADAPVDDVDFQGDGAPGDISGRITSAIGGIVSDVVESPHPYLNNFDQTYVITAHEGATRVRVHFAEIDLMDDGDTIYVLDGNDVVKNTYTARGEDIWSAWAMGRVIKIRIVTNDFGNIGYGFYADGYETDLTEQGGLVGATVTLSPGDFQTTSVDDGLYILDAIPPGTYTVTPSKTHWKFEPTARTVEIPAGDCVPDVDFLAFPPGSITGEIRVAASQIVNVSIESPHPYPNDYEQTWEIAADPSASRIRLHFDRISTEPAWDLLHVMDGSDNIVETYTAEHTDLWTPWIDGSVAGIMLTSDDAITEWGFNCDKYEIETVTAPLAGVQVYLSPDDRTTLTSDEGLFSFVDVDVGTHTVTPSLPHWAFDPSPALVSISPGIERHLFLYASPFGHDTVTHARALADGEQVMLAGAVVSAVFDGFFYVQDPDRTAGVRVTSPVMVSVGDVVDIAGSMATANGERTVDATIVTPH